jgi:hypothetical protein
MCRKIRCNLKTFWSLNLFKNKSLWGRTLSGISTNETGPASSPVGVAGAGVSLRPLRCRCQSRVSGSRAEAEGRNSRARPDGTEATPLPSPRTMACIPVQVGHKDDRARPGDAAADRSSSLFVLRIVAPALHCIALHCMHARCPPLTAGQRRDPGQGTKPRPGQGQGSSSLRRGVVLVLVQLLLARLQSHSRSLLGWPSQQ